MNWSKLTNWNKIFFSTICKHRRICKDESIALNYLFEKFQHNRNGFRGWLVRCLINLFCLCNHHRANNGLQSTPKRGTQKKRNINNCKPHTVHSRPRKPWSGVTGYCIVFVSNLSLLPLHQSAVTGRPNPRAAARNWDAKMWSTCPNPKFARMWRGVNNCVLDCKLKTS